MPPTGDKGQLSGRKKSAILMLLLGPDVASQIYRNLTDQEIEQVTFEIANLGNVQAHVTLDVIEEFYHTAMARQYISHGGIHTAREILDRALGPGKAVEIIERLQGILTGNPFDFLKHIEPNHLLEFVYNEHPQTIALILSHLDHDKAATILSALPHELQQDVVMRIAMMDQTSPEIIAEVERILEKKLSSILAQDFSHSGGLETLAELLNRLEPSAGRNIIQALEENDQELAAEVKKRMFTFDDLVVLDDKALQKILKNVEFKDLALALKGASDEVKNQVFSNISARAASDLKDEMDLMGPVRIKHVEESQQKIITLLRQMEESGEIEIVKKGHDDFIN